MAIEKRLDDGIDVFVQSNTSNLFQAFLQTYAKEDITLTADADINDSVINVSAGHGISVGDMLIIYNNDYFHQEEVKAVSTNAITLYSPLYLPFLSASTTIIRGSHNFAVDGTTPVTLKFGIPSINSDPIDINKAIILMSDATDGDDGTFGGVAALTNGLFLRKENSIAFNLGTYKTNGDFRTRGAEIVYSQKAPAGAYAYNILFYLQGQENFDQVIRIEYGDFLTAKVQDDLTGLLSGYISIIGSYTSGE